MVYGNQIGEKNTGELEKFKISFKIEAHKKIFPQAYA